MSQRLPRLLLLWTFLVFGTESWAAIAFDAASSSSGAAVSSITFSHTIGGGSNRLLVVGIATEDTTSTNLAISSITYNGSAMTLVAGSLLDTGSTTLNRSVMYYALDASLGAAGAHNVVVNFGGSVNGAVVSAISLTGVKQQAAEAVTTNTTVSTSSIASNITTVTANAWVVDILSNAGTGASYATAAANMTERMDAGTTVNSAAAATKTTTTAGSTAMDWTFTSAGNRTSQSIAAFAPAGATQTLSGNVFEDTGYSGGVGRSKATASGVNCASARVELFDSGGGFVSSATTDVSGNYSFTVNQSTTYTVRVVNSSVTSSLGGTSLIPVQTYRTTATTGSAVAVTDRVGGEDPTKADAGNGSTTLAALTAGSLTPQSITSVTVSASNITGLDFGFNFNTIVNTNDSGQGSLRQFITNAIVLSGTPSSVFMISDGSAHSGLRAGLTNQLTSGVAVITVASALPSISGALTLDGTSQTTNIGNTNTGTLGTGGTVGVDGLTLSTVNRPEVEIVGSNGFGNGLASSVTGVTIKGIAIHGFGNAATNADILGTGASLTITQCIIGATASSFSLPTAASGGGGIVFANNNASITNNLVGYTAFVGIRVSTTPTGATISNNEIRGAGTTGKGGLTTGGSSHTVSGNLIADCKQSGISPNSGSSSTTFQNNTVTGCGVGTAGTQQTPGFLVLGTNHTLDRNKIYSNYGSGIMVVTASTGIKITKNSIYSNGTITNDSSAAATAAIGIDLNNATDDANVGTASYYTINDSGDSDTGANNLLNFPVLNTAVISGANITLTGWARPSSVIEFFISDGDSSGFGQGKTYVTTLTEGVSDGDATSSIYGPSTINGLSQGTDTTNKFSFTIATPAGVSVGTKLTATATDASNNTSEFSGQVTVAGVTLSGNVFEDTGYTGGVGRDKATASGVNVSGARVELFDGSGNYLSATTTDASGNYSFTALATNSSYTVRVVNSTVVSSLGGSSLIPVQTYRTTATSGTAVAVTDRVGGEDPTKADSGNGSTTLAALTAGSLLPQSITSVTATTSAITGLNFGYNFNTIVNKNDSGQGSLRQFMTNSNGMSGTQTSVFMISDGSAHAGLRAGITNQLTSGVAIITVTSQLPTPSDAIIFDGTSQTSNIGNTNSGTLGTGSTVGTDGLSLSSVNRPEVEIVGNSSIGSGILMGQNNSTFQGFSIHGFGSVSGTGDMVVGGTGLTITQNIFGTSATSFSLPGSTPSGGSALRINASSTGSFTNNLVGYQAYNGILCFASVGAWTISNNEFRGNGRSGGSAGIFLSGSSLTVSQNLFAANKGNGVDCDSTAAASSSHTLQNNTFSGNGVGTTGTRAIAAVRLYGNSNIIDRNIMTGNYGPGVLVTSGSTGNKLTQNSIYNNGTITNDGAEAATAQLGIDLLAAANNASLGTAPYYTINDSGDGDAGGNNLLNFPVLNTAVTSGSNITLTGWARPGSIIEFFISDSAANGFGQGQTYLTVLTEGSGSDTDGTTASTYGAAAVNGVAQGTDSTNKFSFTVATPGGVSAGTKLTATARDGSNNTSEFSGQVTVSASTITLSGNVSEDTTYTGGSGRDKATASGVNRSGARVELFDGSGNYVSAATTDASGNYSFTVTNSLSYTIRVVNSTVTSSLGGASLIPVQTYRTTATTGSAVAVTDRVGGEDPTKADSGNGSTTLAALTAGSLLPQSITSVTVSTSNITGLDFVYNFNTIVNTNDTGQGSLRQLITNSNGMTGTQSSVFMISDGSAHSGLRAGITNQLTSGVAVITVTTALPQITDTLTLDGTSQTTNVGNTNAGTLGTGSTVGVGAVTLSTVNRPEVEIIGANSINLGLDIAANTTTIKGIAIHGFGNNNVRGDIHIGAFTGITVTQNIIGASASSFSLPAVATGGYGLRGDISSGATVTNTLVGFTAYEGVLAAAGSAAWTVQNNEFRGCGIADAGVGGFAPGGASSTVTGNLFIANKGRGIKTDADSCTYTNNTITGNGVGTAGTPMTPGFRIRTNNNTVTSNIIYNNYGAGIMVTATGTGNKISQNSIYGNGTIVNDASAAATGNVGIDLQVPATDSASTGTAPYYTINDSGDGDTGGNNLLNFPVLDTAVVSGTNLVLTGWARPASIIEFFISDGATNGFGQGQTYLATATEGTSDADATSSAYTNPVNGLNQGADTTNRFSFTIALPGGVTIGTKLTATATDASNNTSEFSGQVTVSGITLSGNVFEDVTYAGGVGRNKATASGVNAAGARVELFDGSGNYVSATTTDASGNYSFTGLTGGSSYTIRVVNSTVVSSLGGSSLIPVQTYRTTATTGSAVAVTDRVGGEDPTKADAGNGSTTLAALTAGSLLPQSITSVTAGSTGITGLDFGYNFNTIVNTTNTGQGSLRQFVTNSNGMSGTQSSVFMISDGSAHSGLRAGITNQLTSGVAVITVSSQLPTPTDAITFDGTTQTTNVGNTNSGTLGTGGTVGVDAIALSTVNRPEVELVGSSGIGSGIILGIANSTLKGFAVHGFGSVGSSGDVVVSGTGQTITQNIIGATATSFSLPGSNTTGGSGIRLNASSAGTLTNNLIGYTAFDGIFGFSGAGVWTVSQNELRGCGRSGNSTAILLGGGSSTFSQNLITASKGIGIDTNSGVGASSSQTLLNNTITANGVGVVGTRAPHGVKLLGNSNVVDRNIIAQNYGAGILITSGSTGNKLTLNSIYGNGTITNDGSEAASGEVGIDLQSATDDATLGTTPYYTVNDSGDGDTGANNLLNFPVLNQANISGSNLVITGWARAGSIIELFISDSASNGFGQGQTYIATVTEGSGSDTDATSSAYTNPVNGLNQGGDTTNRFQFSFALPGGVSNGTKLTATARDGSNNTSEFAGQVTVGTIALSGKVYEDTTYSGGVGRSFATASGTNVSGARVELFDNSGNYVSAATTDASGNYSFGTISPNTSYTVRVVNSTVVSSLGGSSLIPVQTYRTTATTGSAVAVTDRVGGEDPTKADAGNGSTTLAALTAGSVLPQSITTATVTTSAITGLDFGYNFCTLVNKNDTGQGSLRQFITNANGMTGTQSSVFMISDGSAHSGLRAGLTNQLTSGVAVITPATILPSITGAITIDGTTQTTNVGDTNSGTLGTGGTVGVDGVTLSTVNRPEVEIIGSSSFASGLDLQAASCTVKGLAIHGFGSASTHGDITTGNVNSLTVTQTIIGTTASSFASPAATTGGNGIYIAFSGSGSFTNNLVGFTGYNGLYISHVSATTWTIQNNEFRGCGTANSGYGGIDVMGSSHTLTGNLSIANKGQGIDLHNGSGGSLTLLNNTVTGNGIGNASVTENSGIRLVNSNNTVDRNKIYANYGAGVMVGSGGTGNKITRNSIYSNGTILSGASAAASGQIGIDLLSAGNDQSLGTSTYYTINDDGDGDTGANNLLNYPVLDNAMIIGGNLEITGWVTTGATIEFFISDGDASNFGEGQTYIGNVVEGSGSDTDATSSSYSGNVNCFAQGSGTTVHRFKYTFANPGGITAGTTKLTATATDGSNNTSEFSGNVVVYNSNPIFAIVTSSTTISDPVNGATNPKAIPGGVLLFTATVTNSYQARSDTDSFIYTNPIPTNTKLYVGNLGGVGSGPVTFTDGATSSAVTYTFTSLASTTDDLSFSNDNGTTWTYVPTADADTCDANVTNIRINPKGTFAKSACGSNPSCVFQYRLRVK